MNTSVMKKFIFPYEIFKSTKIWDVIDQAVEDLVKNTDLVEKTDRAYIVGYLCKSLAESGLIENY